MAGEWQARLRGASPRVVDAGVAAALAVAMALTIGVAEEADATRSPDYLMGLAVAALVLLRRTGRWAS